MKKSKIEKTIWLIIIMLITTYKVSSQTIITNSKLVISHTDMILFLQSDTNTMVSVQTLSYKNFLKIGSVKRKELGDKWFDDTYKGKFKKKYYHKTKRDLGHLTPFKATSYSLETALNSFSSYNQAPQDYYFNEHTWNEFEQDVLDTISKYKMSSCIMTGVIYNNNNPTYLPNSKIKIPTYFFKVLFIGDKRYYWIGDNTPGIDNPIRVTTLEELNKMFIDNNMDLRIGLNIK